MLTGYIGKDTYYTFKDLLFIYVAADKVVPFRSLSIVLDHV